jgi:hypothetical protein
LWLPLIRRIAPPSPAREKEESYARTAANPGPGTVAKPALLA